MKKSLLTKVRFLLLTVVGSLCSFGSAWAQIVFDESKVYTISLNTAKSDIAPSTTYLNDDGSGTVKVGDFVNADSFKWKFVPGDTEGTYYVQNAGTNQYLQSTVADANAGVKVKMGTTPVAYKIGMDETANAQTKGFYYLCSNNQTVNNTTDGTTGLNYQNSSKSVVCYWIKTGRGNSYWDIKEFTGEITGPVIATEPFSADKYYVFNRMNVEGAHMVETTAGKLSTAAYSTSQQMYWQLIPTQNEGCYYVKNAVTGRYIQSSKQALSSQIPMGSEPVEFKIGKDNTSGATTAGFYYFCSTDQTNIPAGAIGLNYDGNSTKNVVAWYAKSGDQNSYWRIRETSFDYEPVIVPLVESMEDADEAGRYTLTTVDGKQIAAENGTIILSDKGNDLKYAWFFVGTSNKNEGIYLVNMADPTKVLTVDEAGNYSFADPENGTRWFVTEKETDGISHLTFVPYDQKDQAGAPYLTVGGASEFNLGNYRSAYSLATQVYSLPCGALDQGYLTKLDIAGEQVLKELNYTASAKPGDYYNLYTVEKATVARGEKFNLAATVANMDENVTAYVYFDWNRDGLFETAYSYKDGQITDEISVPADAVLGKSRMRVRITNNGLSDAEDDAVGSIYDFIVNIAEPQAQRTITVQPNDPERGTAEILVNGESVQSYTCDYGQEVTVSAVPTGKLEFISWKDNRTVVSTDQEYSFMVTENADLTACFSPNSTLSTDIQNMKVDQNNFVYEIVQGAQDIQVVTDADVKMVYVFAADGTQVHKSTGKKVSVAGLNQGTYIIKVITSAGDGSKKISLK